MKLIKPLLLVFLGCTAVLGSELPDLVIPAGVGVNIHFVRGHEKDLDMIAAAGFKFIRMDFGWGGIERKKGQYDWSAYDELTTNVEKRGIRPLYIFDYSNPLYEQAAESKNPITQKTQRETASPQHPESIEAFARWAAAAAVHYKGRRVVWEIWNEPNISFWKPKPDVQQYTALALATARAVRAADPDATIIGPASSTFPWQFLEEFLKSGILENLDGISVHPYRGKSKPPETAAADYKQLRSLIEKYAPPSKRQIPIISGEWGYSSHTKGVTLEMQADYIARQQLSNLLEGIPLSIWYDWKNDGEDPNENEHNFGTVTYNLEPKPAYAAIQTLTRELAGYHLAKRFPQPDEKDIVLLLTNANSQARLVAWASITNHSVAIPVGWKTSAQAKAVAGNGRPLEIATKDGELRVEISSAPIYISVGKVMVK